MMGVDSDPADAELHPFGWAPGMYLLSCHFCGEQDWNCDKRCSRCRKCAVAAKRLADMDQQAERREQTHE